MFHEFERYAIWGKFLKSRESGRDSGKINFINFNWEGRLCYALFEIFFQGNEFHVNSSVLRRLLKEIHGPTEFQPYHFYLKNTSEFSKTTNVL